MGKTMNIDRGLELLMACDADTFTEIIDDFLTENHVQMLIDMPEGTQEVTVEDNSQLGPVAQFYILLKALPAVFSNFRELIDGAQEENFVDGTLRMVKNAILGEEEDHEQM